MKNLRILFLLSTLLIACNAQTKTNNYSKTIKEQAKLMGDLFVKKDFEAFSKYTYPAVIEMIGDKQKMIEIMEKNSKEMSSQGTDFISVEFGEPSQIINIDNELQSTITEILEIKVPGGKLIQKSTLIAISKDNGKNWYFIDTSGKDLITLQKALPNLSDELVIPEKEQPTFHKEK